MSRKANDLLIACPVIDPPGRVAGERSWDQPLLLIDNTPHASWRHFCAARGWPWFGFRQNLGVAASWNLAAAAARRHGFSFVALISSSVVWNQGLSQIGGCLEAIGDPARGMLMEPLAFHGQVWALSLFDRLGSFDENFWPGYYEDNDWVRRLELSGEHTAANPIPKAELDVRCVDGWTARSQGPLGRSYGEILQSLQPYYLSKWGGLPGAERFETPFGLSVPLSWWPAWRGTPAWQELAGG